MCALVAETSVTQGGHNCRENNRPDPFYSTFVFVYLLLVRSELSKWPVSGFFRAALPVAQPAASKHWEELPIRKTLNCLFSRTTWVSRHEIAQANLDFNESRDGVAVASVGAHANHFLFIYLFISISLATDKTPEPGHSNFLQTGRSSWRPTNSVKVLKAIRNFGKNPTSAQQ